MPKKAAKGKRRALSQRKRLGALLMSVGLKQSEVAKVVGVLPQQVSRWKKDEAFNDYLAEKMAEVESKIAGARDILLEVAPLAALRLLGLLDSEDEAILLRASGDILDRVGIAKTRKLEAEIGARVSIWDKIAEAMEREKSVSEGFWEGVAEAKKEEGSGSEG